MDVSEAVDDAPFRAEVRVFLAPQKAAYEFIHLHGGMGFTWEHDAHLYYRRARADRVLFGDPAAHRAELARSRGWVADR